MANKEEVKQSIPDKKDSASRRSPKQKPAGYRLSFKKDSQSDYLSSFKKPSPIAATVPSFLQVISIHF